MTFRRWYRKHRVMMVSMMACLGFLGLALYGWGVTWTQLGSFLLMLAGLLILLVGAAALAGWILMRLRR